MYFVGSKPRRGQTTPTPWPDVTYTARGGCAPRRSRERGAGPGVYDPRASRPPCTMTAIPCPPPMHAEPRPSPPPPALQLVQQVGRDPRPRGSQRMCQRDRSSVDVHLLAVQAELLLDRHVLRSEGLVDLDQVHVVQREAGLLQRLAGRRGRPDTHDARRNAGDTPRDQAPHRLEAVGRRRTRSRRSPARPRRRRSRSRFLP